MTVASRSRAEEVREGFAHLRTVDPVLAQLIDKRPDYDPDAWLADLPEMDLFGCLVFQILGQQISMKAADAILARLVERCDRRIPGPEALLELSRDELRAMGFSWRKADSARELAARFVDGTFSEVRLAELSDDEVIAQLTQVRGIGP